MNVDTPSSIVLIHGLWMTPRSWENWVARYEERGHRVTATAWPGLEVEAVTEFKEFPGRPHFPGAPGWEEVAGHALDCALRTARRS